MRWEELDRDTLYEGFYNLYRYHLRHQLFAGGTSDVMTRELIDRGHAAGVLPYDPQRDRVVLIEQFRVGAMESSKGPWLMEVVAGLIDPGESPEEVVRRESQEEAGLELGELIHIHDYYSSPGGSNERITLYAARVDSEGAGGIHGLAHEHEDIRVHVMSLDEALERLRSGLIDNAMAIIALQWAALNRERLKQAWG
ncbi:MAG: NUDIX domain-containing protein [Gammaproteobacteria bacterium]|jgi:ADP-ribose pyrophosphatase